MATVTSTGVQPVSLAGYRQLLESRFRENFDETLAVDPETPAGQIISVVDLVAGLETVTNPLPAIEGRDIESDFQFRTRYRSQTTVNAVATRQALIAAVRNATPIVEQVQINIEENDTAAEVTRQGLAIPARGIMIIIVFAGNDDQKRLILQSIADHKPLGVSTAGNQTDSSLAGIAFQSAELVPIQVALVINVDYSFTANGVREMQTNIANYAAGRFAGQTGQFETQGFIIGQGIDVNRLRVPAYAVPGHEIVSLAVTIVQGDAALPAVTPLNRLYTLAAENVTVTVQS